MVGICAIDSVLFADVSELLSQPGDKGREESGVWLQPGLFSRSGGLMELLLQLRASCQLIKLCWQGISRGL